MEHRIYKVRQEHAEAGVMVTKNETLAPLYESQPYPNQKSCVQDFRLKVIYLRITSLQGSREGPGLFTFPTGPLPETLTRGVVQVFTCYCTSFFVVKYNAFPNTKTA